MKKMKRIEAILSKKLEGEKMTNKMGKIKNALEAARLNAETKLIETDEKMQRCVETFESGKLMISQLCELVYEKNETNESIEALKEIEKYLNEDIKVD